MPLYYVAHRLFAAHDRALGGHIAGQLARRVGTDAVFLPFCDTDEENLVSDCKGRRLFELDCAQLRRITGMIAILHGPSLDDGVCMEIGFASALGVPVVIVTTDFQTYGPEPGTARFAFAEPLLEQLAISVKRASSLNPAHRPQEADRFSVFVEQNLDAVHDIAGQAADALLSLPGPKQLRRRRIDASRRLAFIEQSPYLTDAMWSEVKNSLQLRGWEVRCAQRFQPGADAKAVQADWAAIAAADLAVVDARGPETPPGAALITGAYAASGRPVLAAYTGSWHTFAAGREANWRNLMIQYAVSARFAGIAQFTAALDDLPCSST